MIGSNGTATISEGIRIAGVGHAVPSRRVASAEIERDLGLSEGWIKRRTGIVERRFTSDDEAVSDLAREAAEQALDRAAVDRDEVGLLLLATSTPDHLLPPTAPLLAEQLGMQGCGGIDITGACAGFLYALTLGSSFGQVHNTPVLVIGANVLSSRINPDDKATAALFSDAAGAVVLDGVKGEGSMLEGVYLGSDGSKYENINIPAGGSQNPMTAEAVRKRRHVIHMKRGKAVFREAVDGMVRAADEALASAGCRIEDVDWWIPHQANKRITDRARERLGISSDRTISIIERYGNSSAATIPLGLSLAVDAGNIERGDRLLLTAIGAGMIEAGVVMRW